MYGHVETLANAVAGGALSVPGVQVSVKRELAMARFQGAHVARVAAGRQG
jgi:hypothetical protein